MTRCLNVLVTLLALWTVSCAHVPKPYWGDRWGDLPPAQNGQIQICIANVSTPWLMWIPKDASVAALEDRLGGDFFKQNAPDRLYILRRGGGGNGRWMRWLKYDFSQMTRAGKSGLRLHHGDYIYFWSTKDRPVYSACTRELPPHKRARTPAPLGSQAVWENFNAIVAAARRFRRRSMSRVFSLCI